MSLTKRFTNFHELVSMAPEDLGGVLLQEVHEAIKLIAQERQNSGRMRAYVADWPDGVTLDGLLAPIENQLDATAAWPKRMWPQVMIAAMEAWQWLISAGLIMPHPESKSNYIITRRGMHLRTEAAVAQYREDGILPTGLLHHRITSVVVSHFRQGHFDTAVFHAFRELESALHEAVQGQPQWTAQEVVKAAFNPTTGKLRNQSPDVSNSEREAEHNLFQGALGALKNPRSHKPLRTTRGDAARLVIFASHLLLLVDERKTLLDQDSP